MCMLKISRSDERCEVQSQQPYASHTCTHSTSSTSDDQSHINAKGYAASLQFILIFVFFVVVVFFMSEMTVHLREEHWHFRESFSLDGLLRVGREDWNLSDLHRLAPDTLAKTLYINSLSLSLAELPPPKLSVPKLLWHNSSMHTDKIAIRESAEAYFPYSAYGWNTTGSPQLMTITQK